jgi:hypothetical protein
LEIANYRYEDYYDGSRVSFSYEFLYSFELFLLCLLCVPTQLDLGTGLSNSSRELLAVVLFHWQHISILFHAITYTNRPLFGDSEAFNDKSKSDIGAGQSKQLHKVSKASDFNAGGSRDFLLHVYASISGIYIVDDSGAT